ncbi:MAG: RpiB/LacA/LacB family sugar-phosphate isomerase [Candidatus Magasanikbacteria bacterium]|nr:RpiB/LacA/LacB family sugar-phosphate isomerase [Candidatus Magasanikbacteria bacterium]
MYKGSLYIASDHGGYQLKKRLIRYLQNELDFEVEDMGPYKYNEGDDYPDYAIPLAKKVAEEDSRGILICKNGIGVCVAANKVKGVRAGIGYNMMAAETMMTDDKTNILCLAAKLTSEEHSMAIVKKWLETEFSEKERHVRRLKKIEKLETSD